MPDATFDKTPYRPDALPVALVTGAGKRIGRAIAEGLAEDGFAVALHVNTSTADGEAIADRIRARDGVASVIQGDLTDPAVPEQLIEAAQTALGPVRLLINSASIFEKDEIGTLSPQLFDAHYAIHTRAPAFLAQHMAARLPDGDTGLIINVIDQRVWKLTPQFFSYTLSKAALWTATQTMAQALAPRIRVNAIGPGPTLANTRQKQADFDEQASRVPLGRGPDLSEFPKTVRFLWDTPSVTGQMIALDGGQHLAWETPDVVGIEE